MKTTFLSRFSKDIDKIKDKNVRNKIADVIELVEQAQTIAELPNLKKIRGNTIAYRIRIGDYRIGLFIENSIVEVVRVFHRKDIYRVFP